MSNIGTEFIAEQSRGARPCVFALFGNGRDAPRRSDALHPADYPSVLRKYYVRMYQVQYVFCRWNLPESSLCRVWAEAVFR